MNRKIALLLLALCQPALAGQDAPVGLGVGRPGENDDSLMPSLKFGRAAADSDLPGYLLGTINSVYQFESDFDELPGEVSALDFSLWSPIAHFQAGDVHIVPALGLRSTKFGTSIDNLLTEDTLYAIRMPVVVAHDLSNEWVYGGMIMPAFSGDLSQGDNFSISGAIGAARQVNPRLMVGAGMFYSRGFEDDLFLPGLAITWRPSSRWEAFLLGPIGGVTYAINDRWIASIIGQYDALTWNIEADEDGPERDISSQAFRLGLKLERRFTDHFWVQMTGGLSMAREITIEDSDNSVLQEDELDATPFLQLGGNFRF